MFFFCNIQCTRIPRAWRWRGRRGPWRRTWRAPPASPSCPATRRRSCVIDQYIAPYLQHAERLPLRLLVLPPPDAQRKNRLTKAIVRRPLAFLSCDPPRLSTDWPLQQSNRPPPASRAPPASPSCPAARFWLHSSVTTYQIVLYFLLYINFASSRAAPWGRRVLLLYLYCNISY